MRSDAARNSEAILQAARDVVAEEGIGASMVRIAERAGVAVGTLYRHHPSKDHLVGAVVQDATRRLVDLLDAALARIETDGDVGREFETALASAAETYATDRAFKEYRAQARGAAVDLPGADQLEARGYAALDDLVAAAHRAGTLRADVGAADVLEILAAVPTSPERRATYLAVVLAGLRSAPRRDSPVGR
ncbi:TetR/AcrR family transcriptional regulator [Nocardioides sp.]|uniref:TetR/AcrR family transcriptional regulator n=1 Tax=Nocardioides sp. TaxID=35761 RepID=UPI003511CF6B